MESSKGSSDRLKAEDVEDRGFKNHLPDFLRKNTGSAECQMCGKPEVRNAGRTSEERRKNAAQRLKMSKKKSDERGKYFEARLLDASMTIS